MAEKNNLFAALIEAFEDQELCDVRFLAEEKEIGAHKLILKSECKYLFDLSSAWTPGKDPVCIKDIGYDSFKDFLRY